MTLLGRRWLGLGALVLIAMAGCSPEKISERKVVGSRLPLSPIPPSLVAELGSDTSLELDRFGPFAEHVQIIVPEYRGIEPKVALSYSSASTTNDVVGLGWTLLPFAVIERKSQQEGTALLSHERFRSQTRCSTQARTEASAA